MGGPKKRGGKEKTIKRREGKRRNGRKERGEGKEDRYGVRSKMGKGLFNKISGKGKAS